MASACWRCAACPGDAEKRLARRYAPLLALNRDIMLRSLLLQLCFGALTVFGARLGADIVAVNAVLMTMLTFTAYALDGFAYAVEAHSGQAYGARDGSQLLEVWRAACRQSGMVALAFALIYSLPVSRLSRC
jgi:MATE family multidrug resistance protein